MKDEVREQLAKNRAKLLAALLRLGGEGRPSKHAPGRQAPDRRVLQARRKRERQARKATRRQAAGRKHRR